MRRFTITFATIVLSFNLQAAGEEEKLRDHCENIKGKPVSSEYFVEFAKEVSNGIKLYCSERLSDLPGYPAAYQDVFRHMQKLGMDNKDLEKINAEMRQYAEKEPPSFPIIYADDSGMDGDDVIIDLNSKRVTISSDAAECNRMASGLVSGGTCDAAIKDFASVYEKAQNLYSFYNAYQFSRQLNVLEQQWDRFLEESKSQTALELFVNGRIYKKTEAAYFKRPPEWQLILLHPGVVIENVSDAIDGEETNESLALDIIGVNFWDSCKSWLPCGIAWTSTYNDRPGIKDWGNGISLHFDGDYVIGYVRHGNSDGWFVSFDLLTLFKDKKEDFKAYSSNF